MQERDYLIEIAKRLLDYEKSGTTASAKEPFKNPIDTYTDPDFFKLEQQKVFHNEPILACFSSDLPEAGSFYTFDYVGVPILITRDKQGELHAFLNACSHRSARLKEGCGKSASLVCPYHAWRFDLDGKLRGIYQEPTFGEIDKSQYNLSKLPVQEKYGLVYVAARPEVQIDIDVILGDIAELFSLWQLDKLQFVKSAELPVQTNWKLALDTFCEGYHFIPLHSKTVGDYALGNISAYDRFGDELQNHRLAFPNKTILDFHDKEPAQWGDVDELFSHFQLVHFLYPNVSLLVSPNACELFQIFPGKHAGEHITRYTCYWRGHAPLETEQQIEEAEAHFDFVYKVVEEEDYWISANVQKNLNTGLRSHTTFGKNEPALINMHQTFRRKVGFSRT